MSARIGETTRPSFAAPMKRITFTSSLIAIGPLDVQYVGRSNVITVLVS